MAETFTDVQPISGETFSNVTPLGASSPPGVPRPASAVPESSMTDKVLGFLGGTGADVGQGILQGSYKAPPNLPGLMISRALGLKTPNTEAQNTAQRVGQGIEQTGEMIATGGPMRSAATSLASKFPFLGSASGPVARILAESANTGASAAIHGQPVASSALTGAAGAGVGEAASAIAPGILQKALGITGKDTRFGQTPGQALLDNTTALTPAGIADQAKQASLGLTGKMESNVAGSSVAVATDPAHAILDNAINSAPRNATGYKDKLDQLRTLLSLDSSGRRTFSPDEILEMKRGINKEVSAFDIGSRKAVNPVVRQIYNALDQQIDAAVPGNDAINQQISSLITGQKAAQATAFGRQPGLISQIASKSVLPGIGASIGYAHGGGKEAAAFAGAGYALQTPAGRIAIARLMNSGLPEHIARAIVAGQGQQ